MSRTYKFTNPEGICFITFATLGIVAAPEDYIYSSARNYAGLDILLEVELMN